MDFIEAAREYGVVFKYCYDLFLHLQTQEETILEADILALQHHISQLDREYSSFASKLYAEIKDITDWNEQNVTFYQLKNVLPPVIFDNHIADFDSKQALIKEWADREGGYYVIKLINTMHKTLDWFNADDPYKLRRFIKIVEEGQQKLQNELTVPADKHDTDISISEPEIENLINPKCPLTKVAVANLFFILKDKHLIKRNITDLRLSEIVGELTGFSAKQIRLTPKGMPDITKDQLRNFLGEILNNL